MADYYSTYIKILNIFVFALFILHHGKMLGVQTEWPSTIISPSPYIFYLIWFPLDFLLFGFIIYQFFAVASETVLNGIKLDFVFLISLTSQALVFRDSYGYFFGVALSILLAIHTTFLYRRLRRVYPAKNKKDSVWIHAPLSIYHAWTITNAVINSFAALTVYFAPYPRNRNRVRNLSLIDHISVTVSFLILIITSFGYINYKDNDDVLGSLVIASVFFGISIEQEDNIITMVAFGVACFLFLYSFSPFAKRLIRRTGIFGRFRRSERAPLLS
ncbi:hypothetical protein G9A89_002637 [Geosiphon pyriformis]|nr:hypothetical protein G9A89_002637 [Geosiphon pyriformis]